MRSTENKKVTVAAVATKYRCNLCGHLTNNFGHRCPQWGTGSAVYTATDVTFDATSYR